MGKLINEKGEVNESFIADTFLGISDHDVLGNLSLQQTESLIYLLAESHDKGYEAGMEYSFTTEYSKQREKQEQDKIKRTVQKAINESMDLLNTNQVDY